MKHVLNCHLKFMFMCLGMSTCRNKKHRRGDYFSPIPSLMIIFPVKRKKRKSSNIIVHAILCDYFINNIILIT